MSNKVWYSFASSAPAGNKVYHVPWRRPLYIVYGWVCLAEQNKSKSNRKKKEVKKKKNKKKTARTAPHHKGTRAPEYSIINRWATLATYQTDFRSLIFRFRGNLEFCYNFFFSFYFLPSSSHTIFLCIYIFALAVLCRFVNQYACSPSTWAHARRHSRHQSNYCQPPPRFLYALTWLINVPLHHLSRYEHRM